ncbi:FitA-like ribbon-helix-helix domain-containing protein [Methylomagnum sp.]
MASVSVNQLDDAAYLRLRARAAAHGVSVEEEARIIIEAAVTTSPPERLGDLALSLFGPTHGVDLELPRRGPHEPMGFPE